MRGRRLRGELHLTARSHAFIGAFAIVLLPAASWLEGSGQLAWTMFSSSSSFRLDVIGVSPSGQRYAIAPTLLAVRASPLGRARLAGSDQWRFHDVARITVGRNIDALAILACEITDAARVVVMFWDRPDLDTPARHDTATRRCVR